MTRQARYWIFFVIVAVGLALSWGQVGRKTDRVLAEEPVVFLTVEADCRPSRAPCAAAAVDRALVVGPAGDGLALRQTGIKSAEYAGVEALWLDAADNISDRQVPLRRADAWHIAQPPPGAATLRIRISAGGEITVADFPL